MNLGGAVSIAKDRRCLAKIKLKINFKSKLNWP